MIKGRVNDLKKMHFQKLTVSLLILSVPSLQRRQANPCISFSRAAFRSHKGSALVADIKMTDIIVRHSCHWFRIPHPQPQKKY